MKKNIHRTVQIIIGFVLVFIFLRSSSPVLVLSSFLILSGCIVYTIAYMMTNEYKRGREEGETTWPQIISVLILQVIAIGMLIGLVWLLFDRRIEVLATI